MTPDQVQAGAAVATFFAAGLAVWATFRAPKMAAEFAEMMRRNNQYFDEQRRLKLAVFTTLMQYRRQIIHHEAVAGLNLIDVIYIDSQEVRSAWRNFIASTNAQPYSAQITVERYHQILEKMARELGLTSHLSIGDIQTAYYPTGLGQMDEAAALETEDKLKRFKVEK